MAQKVWSFGWKHELPPLMLSNVVVIDVRKMFRNPYKEVGMKELTGLDHRVQEFIKTTRNFPQLYAHILEKAKAPGIENIWVGCVGGRHRSVAIAEWLARDLKIPVEHRDIDL